jgi:hypothetical protein
LVGRSPNEGDLEELKKDHNFAFNRTVFRDFSDSNHQHSHSAIQAAHSAIQAELSLSLAGTIQIQTPQKPSPVFAVSPTMKNTMKDPPPIPQSTGYGTSTMKEPPLHSNRLFHGHGGAAPPPPMHDVGPHAANSAANSSMDHGSASATPGNSSDRPPRSGKASAGPRPPRSKATPGSAASTPSTGRPPSNKRKTPGSAT